MNVRAACCLIFVLCCGFSALHAQEKTPYFRLPANIHSSDYQPGTMLLRLKPGYRQAFQSGSPQARTVNQLQQTLGIQSIRPVLPQAMREKADRQRQRPAVVDVSLLYVVHFDAQKPIEEAINAMYASGMVSYAEPAYTQTAHFTPDDPSLGRQYYLELIQALEAWDVTRGSEDIVIGIVDSGIDAEHEDLRNKKAINEDEIPDNGIDDDGDGFIDNVWGWDFIGDDINNIREDNDPSEDSGKTFSHGTYVAGCAVAEANNARGIAGVGYNTRFLVTKHSYAEDTSNTIYSGYLGISYMASQGVDIINLSFGGPGRNQFVQDLIDYAVLDQGCLVVASAGNDGSERENYPAAYDHVLSVTATDENDAKASFSNTAISVDISAPGRSIYSTALGGQYGSVQGTSFSAPIVAGAAALLKAQYPDMTGQQIGEILRVTADESLYDNTQNPARRMGKGRLNVLRALNEQFPSVRVHSSNTSSSSGNVPQEGDTVLITAAFVNHLWPSSSAFSITLSTDNAYARIVEGEIAPGVIAMNDTISNLETPFRLLIDENTPENTTITLLLTYQDGNYQDYEYLSILVNPSYLNIQENRVATSISSNGRIGFQDNSLDTREEGLGFIFEETNLLFEMGLMLGTSATQLSNSVRSTEGSNPDNDFRSLQPLRALQPGLLSHAEVTGRFNDEGANDSRSNVHVDFRTMVWVEDPNDNYVILQYTIRNEGEDSLTNFHAGLYADWDIGAGGAEDKADWDDATATGYVFSEESALFAGIQELNGQPNYFAIDNDPAIGDSPFGVYDNFTDEEKFTSLSGGIGRRRAGFSTEAGTDVSHTVGSGPYNMGPGDSVVIAFALHAALSLEELLESAEAAQTQYARITAVAQPEAENVTVCYGESAMLEARGAENYRWYTGRTGGEPIGTEASLHTGPITRNTSFFVANVVDNTESIRKEVSVSLELSPAVQLSSSEQICAGDSVVLTVQQADSYRWNTGATSRSITVKEAGSYFVEMRNEASACTTVSDTVQIALAEAPTAEFRIVQPDSSFYQEEALQFQAEEADSWQWDFGDGNTSEEQNPAHRYDSIGTYEVTLLVTNAGGCADSTSQFVQVVTALEEEQPAASIVLAPNPATGQTTLRMLPLQSSATVLMLDMQGKTIKTYQLTQLAESLDIDLQTLAPGTYFVRLITPEQTFTRRLLVKP